MRYTFTLALTLIRYKYVSNPFLKCINLNPKLNSLKKITEFTVTYWKLSSLTTSFYCSDFAALQTVTYWPNFSLCFGYSSA